MPNKHTITFMQEALDEAKLAESQGEVPVGAVVVHNHKIIARAHNLVESTTDATKHAELIAISKASSVLNSWRLDECSLFVTLEPCPMCIGAILLSRIKNLYFGCYDPKQGAVGSLFDLSNHSGMNRSVKVFPEILAQDCKLLLEKFFASLRNNVD